MVIFRCFFTPWCLLITICLRYYNNKICIVNADISEYQVCSLKMNDKVQRIYITWCYANNVFLRVREVVVPLASSKFYMPLGAKRYANYVWNGDLLSLGTTYTSTRREKRYQDEKDLHHSLTFSVEVFPVSISPSPVSRILLGKHQRGHPGHKGKE